MLGLEANNEGGSTIPDLGDPAMREFLTEYLKTAIETFGMDVFRTDFNIGPVANWRTADAKACPLPPASTGNTCPHFSTAPGYDIPPSSLGLASDLCAFKLTPATPAALAAQCAAECCNTTACTAFLSSSNGSPNGLPDRCWDDMEVCPGHQVCVTASNSSGCCFLRGGAVLYSNATPGGNPLPAGLEAGSVTKRAAGAPAPPPNGTRGPTWSDCDGLIEHRCKCNGRRISFYYRSVYQIVSNKLIHADVNGLYKLWDDVRTSQPGPVTIDNCAGGGNRADL